MVKTSHPHNQTRGSEQTTIDQAMPPDEQAVASLSGGSTSIGLSGARIETDSVRIRFKSPMSDQILQLMRTVKFGVHNIGPGQLFREYGPGWFDGGMVDEHRVFTLRAFIRGEQSPNARAHTILSDYYKKKIRPPTTPKGDKTTWEGDKTQYLEVKLDEDDNTEVEIEREPSDYFETEMTRGRDGAMTWSIPFSCRIKWDSCRAIEARPELIHGRAYLEDVTHPPVGEASSIPDDMKKELLLIPSRASIPPAPSQVKDNDECDCESDGIPDSLPSLF